MNKEERSRQLYNDNGERYPENLTKHLSISQELENMDKRESIEYRVLAANAEDNPARAAFLRRQELNRLKRAAGIRRRA